MSDEEHEDGAGGIDEAALDHVVEQQSRRRMTDNERHQVEQIEALEMEELEEEEEEEDNDSHIRHGRIARAPRPGFTFDTSLASRHVYLGDVDDTGHIRAFLEEGSVVRLPILYLEGIVLFPEATLPLKVVRRRCKAAVVTAISQDHAPYTLAVLHVGRKDNAVYPALVGTTAEIRQLRHSLDGSITVVARGRQRFRVQDAWSDDNDTPCCLVKILEETRPLQVPRDAFSAKAAVPSRESGKVPRAIHESPDPVEDDDEVPLDAGPEASGDIRSQVTRFLNGQGTLTHLLLQFHHDDSDEEDGSMVLPRWLRRRNVEDLDTSPSVERNLPATSSQPVNQNQAGESSENAMTRKWSRSDGEWGGASKAWARDEAKWISRGQRAAWPHWVYRMYDAYDLSRRAADMWRQMVELPSMDELVGNPGLLSFFIASKMPLPDETRQELLELDVVYRLRREVQLLESMDLIRCKSCKATIARRSDMLVMSADGPMNAFVNEHGYVHETLTLRKAQGLNLRGRPETQHSWFPGYAWTIANCVCDAHMGWRFTAAKSGMNPKGFWGIRRSQIAGTGPEQ
ncbi:protein cereblon [Selaginella moellendorffii]|nr:protein cereblon [Selaginella moellendorffii]XP_024523254.1 protein cereblon [Selaginella moellendorffii]|eukprot:XP_002993858.2 protein cereblon [Selaginella moellendorffii]